MALVVGLVTKEELESIQAAGYPINNDDPATKTLLLDLERYADSTDYIAVAVWTDADVPDLLVLDEPWPGHWAD